MFGGDSFRETLQDFNVEPSYFAPYTPTQNTIQERQWGIITPYVRAMLHTAQLHVSYSEFAVLAASFVHNRTYHRGIDGVPITLVSGIVPDLSSLRTFGCPAYVHVPTGQRRKLADTAFKGIFVGYPTDSYGYLIYNPQTHRVIVTRHVRLDESFGGRFIAEGQSAVVNDVAAENTMTEAEEEECSSSDDEDILYPANTKSKTFKVTIRFEVPVLRMYWDHQFVDPG